MEEGASEGVPGEVAAEPLTAPWSRQAPAGEEPKPARNPSERINADQVVREKLEVEPGSYRFYVPMVTGDWDKVEKLRI